VVQPRGCWALWNRGVRALAPGPRRRYPTTTPWWRAGQRTRLRVAVALPTLRDTGGAARFRDEEGRSASLGRRAGPKSRGWGRDALCLPESRYRRCIALAADLGRVVAPVGAKPGSGRVSSTARDDRRARPHPGREAAATGRGCGRVRRDDAGGAAAPIDARRSGGVENIGAPSSNLQAPMACAGCDRGAVCPCHPLPGSIRWTRSVAARAMVSSS